MTGIEIAQPLAEFFGRTLTNRKEFDGVYPYELVCEPGPGKSALVVQPVDNYFGGAAKIRVHYLLLTAGASQSAAEFDNFAATDLLRKVMAIREMYRPARLSENLFLKAHKYSGVLPFETDRQGFHGVILRCTASLK